MSATAPPPEPAEPTLELDPFDPALALRAPAALTEPNRSGELLAADIHVARAIAALGGVEDPEVLRQIAAVVAAARQGSSYIELDPTEVERLRACTTVVGAEATAATPLLLSGNRLYLRRYWREERRLADALKARNRMRSDVGDLQALGRRIAAAFPDPRYSEQRTAAAVAMLRDLSVIAGGPGTGKTTTVARIVALLQGLESEPLIALCAPTGKAAARMQEATGGGVRAATIHRLLGWLPGDRFRHHAGNRLPHDVVIVDETSMVPLWLMVRLVEAVRDDARLVLVGDPGQLAAIQVGAVLRDIVGPAAEHPQFGPGMRATLARVTGEEPPGAPERSFGDAVALLRHGHRSVAPIGALAEAIRAGDEDATVAALRDSDGSIVWLPDPLADAGAIHAAAATAFAPMIRAAQAGDAAAALAQLASYRLLCAHRHGPYGVAHWTAEVEAWLAAELGGLGVRPYAGLPLLVTRNDYELRLNNGDTGVVVASEDGALRVVFEVGGTTLALSPTRLADVEPLFATTVHKSQGSEFETAALVLPEPDSPLLTRELLYTAVTRARRQLIVAGGEASVRAAVARPAGRASGLRDLLWGEEPGSE